MDLPGENPLIRKCLRVSRTTRFLAPPFAFLGLAQVAHNQKPVSGGRRFVEKNGDRDRQSQFQSKAKLAAGSWKPAPRSLGGGAPEPAHLVVYIGYLVVTLSSS
jgi:hypothetical protein